MSCAHANGWHTGSISRYVSVGVFKQMSQLLNVNAANLHRFPGALGVRGWAPRLKALAQHYLRTCPAVIPGNGEGRLAEAGNGWVRACFASFPWTSSNSNTPGWFARCDSSVHCQPWAVRGVLLLILQFLSLSICCFSF